MLEMLAFENQLLQIHVAVIKVYQLIIKILRIHILHLSKKTKLGVYFSQAVSRCDRQTADKSRNHAQCQSGLHLCGFALILLVLVNAVMYDSNSTR